MKKKNVKVRKVGKSLLTSVETGAGSYINPGDISNALLLPAKVKKKKVKKEDAINRKKAEARKRRIEEKNAKVSRTKRKKLMKIFERKKEKESKESLLERLKEYQLPMEVMNKIAKKIDANKHKKYELFFYDFASFSKKELRFWEWSEESFIPKKLSVLAGREIISSMELKQPVQENYYETDSESEDDVMISNEISIIEPSTSKFGVACKPVKSPLSKQESVKRDVRGSGFVPVDRCKSVELQRSKLPIYCEEQSIMEAISDNSTTIICGQTGSGKTTQLPQFLFEAGYAREGKLIGITEPRRLAAISMAARVAHEMNLPNAVSYQIKYESNRSSETSILFMTDGVLMREMQKDVVLSAYSVIIIDEAHERSMYSDVLIGLLTRVAPYRARIGCPLKLIIMSATLCLDDFKHKRLFPVSVPPVLNIDTRQYPVNIHFEKRTPENYLTAAFHKICKIHEQKGPGTILVFLSGRLEVKTLLKWLVQRYEIRLYYIIMNLSFEVICRKPKRTRRKEVVSSQKSQRESGSKFPQKLTKAEDTEDEELNDDRFADADNLDCIDSDFEDNNMNRIKDFCARNPSSPLFCLPLYSLLSSKKQQRIFEPVPDGHRMCVIATNVAETSLTIPAVRFVIDSGREKKRYYDPVTGVSQFLVSWISQASANQRAGRAGRVQPGEVYRLYSSAVYSDLEKFTPPEILTKPIDQLVLHLKSMNIIKVANFPFPTPPDNDSLQEAETRLIRLGALQVTMEKNLKEARISPLGKTLSIFPLAPAFAKMLVMANQYSLMPYACCLVAALSVREPLISLYSLRGENAQETQKLMLESLRQRRAWCPIGQARNFGDLNVLMRAILSVQSSKVSEDECQRFGVRHKALIEIRKLWQQLAKIINSKCKPEKPLTVNLDMKLLTDEEMLKLRQIATASLTDNIAKRVDPVAGENVPKGAYYSQKLKDYIFIDPGSVLFKDEPDWVLYQEIVERKGKKCMQNIICVDENWLPRLANTYCHFKPIKDAEPRYDSATDSIVILMEGSFSDRCWPLGKVEQPLPVNINLYRYFAQFFLDGSVCLPLAQFADKLLLSPCIMTKPWAKFQSRTENLLNALIEHEVVSRARLLEVWKNKSEYLLDEYLEWLPQFLHETVQLSWPPNR
ncbi:unnamed protein product [Thelazia callipaeda]|uniref:RNA helicase n=1 Tax=Thelazia callipaeda TaxID=103827 RepID=A0A0N5D244_THECL|nr:unnamed protein product [Thelazia callipaeda]